MCFVLHVLTINDVFFFFHKYSLKCMALFFLSLLTIMFFLFHECSVKCTALFFEIHVVFNFNFLKDNETFKSVIKGKQLHTLSSLQIHIILDEFDFGPDWTIGFIFPLSVEFYSRENAVDTTTPLTRAGIKSRMNLILGQIRVLLQGNMPLSIETFPID